MIGWTASALAAAGGYAAACHLTGENLLAVLQDELDLRRRSLPELDRACSENARRVDLVVSLTTIPSRLGLLAPTLKSLLRQTVRPAQIRLCLPEWSLRENCAYAPPQWLRDLRQVTIVRVADEGPATKFLPTLRALSPGRWVAVVDDDRIYHPQFLERLGALAAQHPDQVVSGAGWNLPADLIDRPTTLWARLRGAPHVPIRANRIRVPRRVDVVQGLHGYAVRPGFFDLAALGDFSGFPAAVRWVDDVWLSAHCRAPKWVHPVPLPFLDYQPMAGRGRYAQTSLGRNFNRADDPSRRGNSVALRSLQGQFQAHALIGHNGPMASER